jgi:hypothetical protein
MGRHRKIYLVAGLVAAMIVAGAIHNELLGPVIRADPIRADDPLTIRFAVFNPAFTLTLRNVDMTCLPQALIGHGKDGHAWKAPGQAFPLNVDLDVPPRMAFEYTCPIQDTGFPGPVDTASARIAIRYTRLGQRHQAISRTLDWDASSRVWTLAGF